jgi:Tfp pilus assembly protein PilE
MSQDVCCIQRCSRISSIVRRSPGRFARTFRRRSRAAVEMMALVASAQGNHQIRTHSNTHTHTHTHTHMHTHTCTHMHTHTCTHAHAHTHAHTHTHTCTHTHAHPHAHTHAHTDACAGRLTWRESGGPPRESGGRARGYWARSMVAGRRAGRREWRPLPRHRRLGHQSRYPRR